MIKEFDIMEFEVDNKLNLANVFPFFITNVMHSNVDSFGSTSAIEEGPSHFKYGSDLRLSSMFSTQS